MFKTFLKHEKTFFIYVNIFLLDPNLIKTPRLLILETFVDPRSTIRTPSPLSPPHLYGTEEYVFQNPGVAYNY